MPPAPSEHEITRPGPLHADSGALAEPGFSRRPLLQYDPARIRATPFRWLTRLRLKEWDFYAATTKEMTFATAVAHGGIVGVVFAQLVELRKRTVLERQIVTPLGRGVSLPLSSTAGDVRFRSRRGVEIDFTLGRGEREVRVRWPEFDGGLALDARLVAKEAPTHESIVVATPIGAHGFYYNRKTCALPTEGEVALGTRRTDLGKAGAFTTIDWGRGVWPYRTTWVWATGSGRLPDGRTFGLNLGCGFGDTSRATENCFFVDGRMTKLGAVEIDFDPDDPCARAWRFRAADGRLELTLAPDLFVLRKGFNALVVASRFHQITGVYRGRAVTDAGEKIAVEGVIGWAEVHRARW